MAIPSVYLDTTRRKFSEHDQRTYQRSTVCLSKKASAADTFFVCIHLSSCQIYLYRFSGGHFETIAKFGYTDLSADHRSAESRYSGGQTEGRGISSLASSDLPLSSHFLIP